MSKHCQRIPVVYRNKPLMPMSWQRAKRFCRYGLGKICSTKDNFQYLKLLKEPSGYSLQPIILGIDPGANYDGFTILSENCHLLNIELIHTEKIKERMDKRRMYRRIRRGRLWHRPTRFDNRTSSKLCPTIRSKVEFRIFMMNSLLNLYPISKLVIEDVKFNHAKHKWGKWFSLVESGKNYLYNYLKENNVEHSTIVGYDTKKRRIEIYGIDKKNHKKDAKSFYAHCIDSFSIASTEFDLSDVIDVKENKRVYFINRHFLCRRELYRHKNKVKDKRLYYKYKKGGEKFVFNKMSKVRKLRIKPDDSKSYHGPWTYQYSESTECFKGFDSRYGGTIITGWNRWKKEDIGLSKRFVLGKYIGYKNRDIRVI